MIMAYPGDTQLEKLFDSVHVKKALPGIMAALEFAILVSSMVMQNCSDSN